MKVNVKKWGNSLAVRIPKPLAEESSIDQGSVVEVSLDRGRIIVQPTHPRPRFTLVELLRAVRKDHVHPEVDTGLPLGREAW